MEAVNFCQNFLIIVPNHRQTRKPCTVMSMTQKNEWMFPGNTSGHHKQPHNKKRFPNRRIQNEISNSYREEVSS